MVSKYLKLDELRLVDWQGYALPVSEYAHKLARESAEAQIGFLNGTKPATLYRVSREDGHVMGHGWSVAKEGNIRWIATYTVHEEVMS